MRTGKQVGAGPAPASTSTLAPTLAAELRSSLVLLAVLGALFAGTLVLLGLLIGWHGGQG